MAFEIEHKFLVKNDAFRQLIASSESISQGYLNRIPERTVRVRIKGDRGFLTVKGKGEGIRRPEFEYEVPVEDARRMLEMCEAPIVEKVRHIVPFGSHIWEVDEFMGKRRGLITAEIELRSEDEAFELPDFVGEDVTDNPAYCNSNL